MLKPLAQTSAKFDAYIKGNLRCKNQKITDIISLHGLDFIFIRPLFRPQLDSDRNQNLPEKKPKFD